MRLLVLITDAFGGNGGIALYNKDLLTALCNLPNCEKIIAIPRMVNQDPEPIPEKLIYLIKGKGSKFNYLKTILHVIRKDIKFDLMICAHINLLPIAYLLKIYLKIPIILELYGIEAWKPPRKRYLHYLIKKIDTFVAISEVTKRRFLNWASIDEKKIMVIPNAIHLERYGPGTKNPILMERYNLQEKSILMTLGRMEATERYKGFDKVIEILAELSLDVPNITYLIVGEGNDRKRLMEKVERLGLTKHVIFTGYILETEKVDYYRLADVFIMPGKGEGFGFVFLEAMACGIPVIASKTDGSFEAVLGGKLGLVVDPDNTHEIKVAILEALKRPKGIPAGLEYYSFDNFMLRVQVAVNNLIKT